MDAIPILTANLMLICGYCEGALVLRKITITIDEGTLDCLRAIRELNGTPFSASIRLAVLAYYQSKVAILPAKDK